MELLLARCGWLIVVGGVAVLAAQPAVAGEQASAPRAASTKILMLGDSVTLGGMPNAVLEAIKGLSSDPSKGLTEHKIEWLTFNAGAGGETAEGGKGRIGALLGTEKPDIVTICYGLNEIWQKHSPQRFRDNMNGIIEIVQTHAYAARVVLITATPFDNSRHFLGKEKYVLDQGGLDFCLDAQFNGVTRQLANQRGLPLVDLHRYFKTDTDPMRYLVQDGVHLNAAGYTFAGSYIARCLLDWYKAEVLKDADAIRMRTTVLDRLAKLRVSTTDPNERERLLVALDEIWHTCPYLAEQAVIWHRMTYPAAASLSCRLTIVGCCSHHG